MKPFDVRRFISAGSITCQYDSSPEAALAAVCAHEGPILVDCGETLYLRNSTEDFIDLSPSRANVASYFRRKSTAGARNPHPALQRWG
jgi:hypothetical protein